MKLTKPEIRKLKHGLHLAIAWNDSLIDAHNTSWDKRIKNKMPRHCISQENRSYIAKLKREINGWKKLLVKVRAES